MTTDLQIKLPDQFAVNYEQPILGYLVNGRRSLGRTDWKLVLDGFDLLHQAQIITELETLTFKQAYVAHVEQPFADLYINALLQLENVSQEYHELRARIARQIVNRLKRENLHQKNVPASNLFLAYCLYFWESFAMGYAFEVEIYRDLTQSGIAFQAHDMRNRLARLSAYDLQILNQHGDIKTSLYFIHAKRGRDLRHDFYITRFYEGNRRRTFVVMLKPHAWEQINGDTVKALLEEATKQFPSPVMVQIKDRPIVIIDYNVWKTKVLKRQQNK